ncbi:hypothetical protein PoB_006384400 [Plakobranchus ocellatus]|uniref:Uncharacterized protein n=1 Tax=Plakobranchus ocellatus TaxID=259542 RepID=A0AAV4CZU8_9GAST|nr:hypothetical protein PoB_006384400 [Plakobranchus ocellatus]
MLYEYQGNYPGARHAHRKPVNPERTGAYIRLQPQVMDKLKEDVRTQKLDKLDREANVLYGLEKIYTGEKEDGMNKQTNKTGTFADL